MTKQSHTCLNATQLDASIKTLTTKLAQSLEMVPLSSLNLSERNPRTHNRAQIDLLVNSMRLDGKPIEADVRILKSNVKEK